MKKVIALAMRDFKNLLRDYVLLFSFLGPMLLACVLYFVLPMAEEILLERLAFDLTVYYPLIYVFLILFTPMIIGLFMGFIILDEKDDDILSYIAVTELGKSGFLMYRIISPTVISIIMSLIVVNILPLTDVSIVRTIMMILVASLNAPIIALFLGCFAKNKVEGLAYSKGLGILFSTTAISYMVQSNWKYFAALFPPFWVSEILIAENIIIPVLIAVVIHLSYVYFLVKRFSNSYK